MTNSIIYLDYMATTPVDPRIIPEMLHYLGPNGVFANPSSTQHLPGQEAARAIEVAREQIAQSIGAQPEALVFTSGATEANNLAILGAARFYQRKGKHLITLSTEHKSVLNSFQALEKEGFEVTYLPVQPDGLLDFNILQQALRPDTILVSIMHVNNEIGVIQDIEKIGRLLQEKGIVFHVDAAQSAGRLHLDLNHLPVHLMSFSAHKNYGPKGIGALFIRQNPKVRIQALSFGGGQERGLRSGTLPTHQIVGMGAAFALSESIREEEQSRLLTLSKVFKDQLLSIPGLIFNGSFEHRIPGHFNFSIQGIDGEKLLPSLSRLALSSSSACGLSTSSESHVLKELGLHPDLIKNAIRLSFGRFTTAEELNQAFLMLAEAV